MNKYPEQDTFSEIKGAERLERGKISEETLATFESSFRSREANRVARNAIVNATATDVGLNREAVVENPMTFSEEIESGDITHQRRSGRCWVFAGLNRLRIEAMRKMNIDSLELSAAYIMFWDKLEKANFFLENVLRTLDEPLDSRLFRWLVNSPIGDAGQWDMFANIVEKYGVVPREVYPESTSSNSTKKMNAHLTEKLREWASELRERASKGESAETLRYRKEEMLDTTYRILSIHNGEPPKTFDWSWRDKRDRFYNAGTLTPKEFFDEFIDFSFDDYVSLLHCPTGNKPFNRLYTVDFLGNVLEGRSVLYLNVRMDLLKETAKACIRNGEAVWFGCDVGERLHREEGILDTDIFEFETFYDTEFRMDKGQRVEFGHSKMTHAMLLTGVHLERSRPVRWKVENSWGEETGKNGFLVMDDEWFDEYVFQVVVPKSRVPARQLSILDEAPVTLPPWDPMGSLAMALDGE